MLTSRTGQSVLTRKRRRLVFMAAPFDRSTPAGKLRRMLAVRYQDNGFPEVRIRNRDCVNQARFRVFGPAASWGLRAACSLPSALSGSPVWLKPPAQLTWELA